MNPSTLGFCVTAHRERIQVLYARPRDAFRALGLLFSVGDFRPGDTLAQACPFESLGVMLDVSRNGVFTVEAIESLFSHFALMGIDSVQLYMEDVFLLPEEPFFGYARGAYTHEELRRIDDCGHRLGIEVIPCVQTLGHMEQILQWPAYAQLADVPGVLLVGEDKTYSLLGKILDMAVSCFRSRRIHIGMDEAHGVGSGRFLSKHGFHRPFDILNRHLKKVVELCQSRNLAPMIWSDMYFRIGSETNDYYDKDASIPDEVIDTMSPDVDLVYWDYYHADPEFYKEWIRRHRAMGKEPIFAAGAWTWGRFWAHWSRWNESISAGMQAARSEGLKSTFLTAWGDDGSECHPFSMLPAVQYFAECAYNETPDKARLDQQFEVFCSQATLDNFRTASQLDETPSGRGRIEAEANLSKWLLWHDPILGFLNSHITEEVHQHFVELAVQLEGPAATCDSPVKLPAALAQTLAFKSEIHLKLRAAYSAGDRGTLEDLLQRVLPQTLSCLDDLREIHSLVWEQWFKPFGWEVLDRRYGGIIRRLQSLSDLLAKKLANPELRIPELELDPLPILPMDQPEKFYFDYSRVITASTFK